MTTQTSHIHGPRIHGLRVEPVTAVPPRPAERIDPPSPSWWQRLRTSPLAERLRQFAYALRAAFAVLWGPSSVVTPNRAAAKPGWWIETPEPPPPPIPAKELAEPEVEKEPPPPTWLTQLRDFGIYLGTVAAICLLGIYLLWQIPFVQEPSQLLGVVDDLRISRPESARNLVPSDADMQSMAGTSAPTTTTVSAMQQSAAATPAPATATTTVGTMQQPIAATPAPATATGNTVVVLTAPAAGSSNPAGGTPAGAVPPNATGTDDPAEAVVILQDDAAPPAPGEPVATLPPAVPGAIPSAPGTPGAPALAGTAETPPVPPAPQVEIQQLLADAQLKMENRRFTAPASGNALSNYQRVLELQPDHPAALEGMQRISNYYRDIAQRSLQQGRVDESLAYVSRGLRAMPKDSELLSLRSQAQQARERARKIQAEQERRQLAIQRDQEAEQQRALMEEFERRQTQRVWQEPSVRQEQPPIVRRVPPSQGRPPVRWPQPDANNNRGNSSYGNPNSGFNQR